MLTVVKSKLCFCLHQVWPGESDPGNCLTGHFCISPVEARGQVKCMILFSSPFHSLVEWIKTQLGFAACLLRWWGQTWREVPGLPQGFAVPFLGVVPATSFSELLPEPGRTPAPGATSFAGARRWHDTRGEGRGDGPPVTRRHRGTKQLGKPAGSGRGSGGCTGPEASGGRQPPRSRRRKGGR